MGGGGRDKRGDVDGDEQAAIWRPEEAVYLSAIAERPEQINLVSGCVRLRRRCTMAAQMVCGQRTPAQYARLVLILRSLPPLHLRLRL